MKTIRKCLISKSSFTLLEIIIVLIIMGVLASVAIPKFTKTVKCSRTMGMMRVISRIRIDLETCYYRQRSYAGCGANNFGMAGSHVEEFGGYCFMSSADGVDPQYYEIRIYENDGDSDCDGIDMVRYAMNTALAVRLRSDVNGKYKFYGNQGCLIDYATDPDAR